MERGQRVSGRSGRQHFRLRYAEQAFIRRPRIGAKISINTCKYRKHRAAVAPHFFVHVRVFAFAQKSIRRYLLCDEFEQLRELGGGFVQLEVFASGKGFYNGLFGSPFPRRAGKMLHARLDRSARKARKRRSRFAVKHRALGRNFYGKPCGYEGFGLYGRRNRKRSRRIF